MCWNQHSVRYKIIVPTYSGKIPGNKVVFNLINCIQFNKKIILTQESFPTKKFSLLVFVLNRNVNFCIWILAKTNAKIEWKWQIIARLIMCICYLSVIFTYILLLQFLLALTNVERKLGWIRPELLRSEFGQNSFKANPLVARCPAPLHMRFITLSPTYIYYLRKYTPNPLYLGRPLISRYKSTRVQ